MTAPKFLTIAPDPSDPYSDANLFADHPGIRPAPEVVPAAIEVTVPEVPALVVPEVVDDGPGIVFVDWTAVFGSAVGERAAIDGFLFYGRWTQNVGPAKVGKSELTLAIGHCLARGLDPFGDAVPGERVSVIYYDAEMGRLDVVARLEAAEVGPADVAGWLHYSDQPWPLNVPQGAQFLLDAVDALGARVVILDGLNGFVRGEEAKPEAWRELYSYAIAPLKARGVAILSNDNMGKDKAQGSRGSSAKVDKADLVYELTRTEEGVRLKRTHARTALASEFIDLKMHGADGSEPVRYSPVSASWPAGTKGCAELLDRLGVGVDETIRAARAALKGAGHKVSNEALSAAVRWRKSVRNTQRNTLPAPLRNTTGNAPDETGGELL